MVAGSPEPITQSPAATEALVLIVPNFSEGRRSEVMDAIVAAMTAVPGITLLNRQSDPDQNRLDTTLIGSPAACRAAALAGAARAVQLIDMEQHSGSHPRMGAVDVIPFIPIRGATMDDCVQLAREVGRELAQTLSLPVYLYERAASAPDRVSLADVRRGEYEGLKRDVAKGLRLPDLGPHEIGRAGATAVGARPPLVAFNVYLSGTDQRAAKEVARRVRERSGGLVSVRAIGFAVPGRGCVEVSINLLDPLVTPPYRALELVRLEAARYGMHVLDTEIVGLTPLAALAESAIHYLQLRGFQPAEQVIETLVARQAGDAGSAGGSRARADAGIAGLAVGQFLDALASSRPAPGGGAVAAVAGSAGAALLAMVARLTSARKDSEGVRDRMGEVILLADRERAALLGLAERDTAAFDAVMAAYKLPRHSDEERAARAAEVQAALVAATEVPREVAQRACALMPVAVELVETGAANAVSDAVSAGWILHSSVVAALANVDINLNSLTDRDFVEMTRTRARGLRAEADAMVASVDARPRHPGTAP